MFSGNDWCALALLSPTALLIPHETVERFSTLTTFIREHSNSPPPQHTLLSFDSLSSHVSTFPLISPWIWSIIHLAFIALSLSCIWGVKSVLVFAKVVTFFVVFTCLLHFVLFNLKIGLKIFYDFDLKWFSKMVKRITF